MTEQQRATTPPIALCAKCGAKAECFDDSNEGWRVICNNNHTATNRCGSRHRAVCRWNNAQERLHKLNSQLMNNKFTSAWTSVIALILFFLINAALVWISLNFLIGYSLTPLASLGYVLLLFVVRIVFVADYSALTRSY